MKLLEDMLTDAEISAISAVMKADTVRFDVLVDIAGLDRKADFSNSDLSNLNLCGADLRGFDFSGSDLRGCWKNRDTLFDETTSFENAKVDWVEVEELPIVLRMQDIGSAANSKERTSAISELIAKHGRTPHVVKFLVFTALRSESVDEFLDFISFLPRDINPDYARQLREIGGKLLDKRLAQSRNRSGKGRYSVSVIEGIVERLSLRRESLSGGMFDTLSLMVQSKPQTKILKGMASVEASDLREAFSSLGTNR